MTLSFQFLAFLSAAFASRWYHDPNHIDMVIPPTRSRSWWRPFDLPVDKDIADSENILATKYFEFRIAMPYIEVEDWTSDYLGNVGIACTEFCESKLALGARLAPEYSSSSKTFKKALRCDCFSERIESLSFADFNPKLHLAKYDEWNDLDYETLSRMGHGYYARRIHPYTTLKTVDSVFEELTAGEIDQLSAQSIYPQWHPLYALQHLKNLQTTLGYVKERKSTDQDTTIWTKKLQTALATNSLSKDLIIEFQKLIISALNLERETLEDEQKSMAIILFEDFQGQFIEFFPLVSNIEKAKIITGLLPLNIQYPDLVHWVIWSITKPLVPEKTCRNTYIQEIVSTRNIPPNIEMEIHTKFSHLLPKEANKLDCHVESSHSFKDATSSYEATLIAVDTWLRMVFQTPISTFGPVDKSNIEIYGYSAPYDFTFKLVIWTLCRGFSISSASLSKTESFLDSEEQQLRIALASSKNREIRLTCWPFCSCRIS